MKHLLLLLLAACTPTPSAPRAGLDDTATIPAADTDVRDTSTADTGPTDTDLGDSVPLARLTADSALARIASETPGLLFLSESESTVTFGAIEDGASPFPTALTVRDRVRGIWDAPEHTTPLQDRLVEEQTLARFFDRLTLQQDGWEDFDRMQQPHWQALRDVFETGLTHAAVFRLGEHDLGYGQVSGAIEVYVVGASRDGHLVWIHVRSIET